MLRVLHFSDVHLERGFKGVPLRQFMNKRVVGYANLALRRRSHFADAPEKVEALARFIGEQNIDISVGTGDYTALGTWPELEYAREVMQPLTEAPMGFVTVPGNHDVYLRDTTDEGRFERHFGEFLVTDRPDLASEDGWPHVRLFGDHLACVAINSARPNHSVRKSSGRIPDAQIEALKGIVADPDLSQRFLMVLTHYAPRLASGRPDSYNHGLENAEDFLDALRPQHRGVICHGHVHWNYHVREPGLHLDLCCAGSTTHEGREGIWVYEIGEDEAFATPGGWNEGRYVLDTARRTQLNTPAD